MVATLPTNWNANHYPTAAECKQVLDAITALSSVANYWASSASAQDITSTSYADITSASVTFTKYSTSTSLEVTVAVNAYILAGNPFETIFGVQVNSVDYDVAKYSWTTTAEFHAIVGTRIIASGLASGTYTIKLRGKNNTAAKTSKLDSGSNVSFTVREVWA